MNQEKGSKTFERDADDGPSAPMLVIGNEENKDFFFFGSALGLTNAQRVAEENEPIHFDVIQCF